MNSRWVFYVSLGVLLFACLASFAAGSIEWSDRTAMVPDNPSEAAEQAQFASELFAIGVLNILATLLFVTRTGWAWTAALATQVGIFAFALLRGFVTDSGDIGWIEFATLPLATGCLLIGFRFVRPLAQGQLKAT